MAGDAAGCPGLGEWTPSIPCGGGSTVFCRTFVSGWERTGGVGIGAVALEALTGTGFGTGLVLTCGLIFGVTGLGEDGCRTAACWGTTAGDGLAGNGFWGAFALGDAPGVGSERAVLAGDVREVSGATRCILTAPCFGVFRLPMFPCGFSVKNRTVCSSTAMTADTASRFTVRLPPSGICHKIRPHGPNPIP